MDKATVRIIILTFGILIIAGIYVWGRYKQKILDFLNRRGEYDELGYEQPTEARELAQSVVVSAAEPAAIRLEEDEDMFDSLSYTDVVGREAVADDSSADSSSSVSAESISAPQPKSKPVKAGTLGAPFLVQVSVVAGRDRFFRGEDLRDALLDMDLVHGQMGIFHRYDRAYRESLFSVASLVEPGTFPMFMDSFECPGVALFFQPAQVSNPLAVFDDLVATCHELANRLGGIEWDEARQPLTPDKIAHMRTLLEDACE